jgi:hypothetical protein
MYPEFPKFINDGDFTNDNDVKKFKSDIAKHKKTKKKLIMIMFVQFKDGKKKKVEHFIT